MFCVAPCGDFCCGQLTQDGSKKWCVQHYKYLHNITYRYHELEKQLSINPYSVNVETLQKLSKEEALKQYKLLYRIYMLRSKIRESGFAKEFRDVGHSIRLNIINRCMCILNECNFSEDIEVEEDTIIEKDDELQIMSTGVKLINPKNIEKDGSEFKTWSMTDASMYMRRILVRYLLECLYKYFTKYPNGLRLLKESLCLAYEMSKCRCYVDVHKKRPNGDLVHYSLEEFVSRDLKTSGTNEYLYFILKYGLFVPIVAVLESYNINLEGLVKLVSPPTWMAGILIESEATDYYRALFEHPYLKTQPDIFNTMLNIYNKIKERKMYQLNIPLCIKLSQLNQHLLYGCDVHDNKIIYRKITDDNRVIYEQDITDYCCDHHLSFVCIVDFQKMRDKIGWLLDKSVPTSSKLLWENYFYPVADCIMFAYI